VFCVEQSKGVSITGSDTHHQGIARRFRIYSDIFLMMHLSHRCRWLV
jgi:hypothetical protein